MSKKDLNKVLNDLQKRLRASEIELTNCIKKLNNEIALNAELKLKLMKREIEAKKHSNAVKEKDLQIIFLQKTINDLESKLLSFPKKKRKKLLLKLQLN
ncbi:MAG: hypothetical protein NXI23_19625 [Bacteroidetes bacterium]|nr:hypothetical protein [Bacteroidota bacterium]